MQPDHDTACQALDEEGWVVLSDVAPPELFDELRATLDPLLDDHPTGRNPFEGHATKRVNNLLAKGEVFQRVVLNEPVLSLAEVVLGPHLQLSIITAIQILPGESEQGFHTDDGLYPLPHPHPPVVFNTMWALDDFTEANGATRLLRGSHRWPDPGAWGERDDLEVIAAEMPRGSVLVWIGNLVHEGGANQTGAPRLGLACNYNQAWLRQQENQYLGVPRETVEAMPERLQRLVGYDIHPPFIGNVDGRNPAKLVRRDA